MPRIVLCCSNITTCTVLLCRNVGSGSIVSRQLCELSGVVAILLHVLYCYVEMWALGALCPGGFV